jgi:hypothetical protein
LKLSAVANLMQNVRKLQYYSNIFEDVTSSSLIKGHTYLFFT